MIQKYTRLLKGTGPALKSGDHRQSMRSNPDAVLEYPQSGEIFCGVGNIQNSRTENPSERHFFVKRVRGEGESMDFRIHHHL